MTGNNKFWRASLAGLASVAMLATMGVAASTANASVWTSDSAPTIIVYRTDDPANVKGTAQSLPTGVYGQAVDLAAYAKANDPYAGDSDKIVDYFSYDLAGKYKVEGDKLPATGDVKLFAQPKAAVTVTFDVKNDDHTTGNKTDNVTVKIAKGDSLTKADYADAETAAAVKGETLEQTDTNAKVPAAAFVGWSYDHNYSASGTNLYEDGAITENTTLYPAFAKDQNVATVSFREFGQNAQESNARFTLDGHPFPAYRAPQLASAWDGYDFKTPVKANKNTPNTKYAEDKNVDVKAVSKTSAADPNNYTVHIDMNGAGIVRNTFDNDGIDAKGLATIQTTADAKLIKPADPANTGAVFTGWYLQRVNGQSVAYDFNKTVKENFADATGNVTLYAGWDTDHVARLQFNLQYKDKFAAQIVKYVYAGSKVTLPAGLEEYYQTQAQFDAQKGEYSSAKLTGWEYGPANDVVTELTAPAANDQVALTAHWGVTVSYRLDAQGGKWADGSEKYKWVDADPEASSVSFPTPSDKAGYTFAGWEYDGNDSSKSGSVLNQSNKKFYKLDWGKSDLFGADIKKTLDPGDALKAVWRANSVTVTEADYTFNGTLKYENKQADITAVTEAGYTKESAEKFVDAMYAARQDYIKYTEAAPGSQNKIDQAAKLAKTYADAKALLVKSDVTVKPSPAQKVPVYRLYNPGMPQAAQHFYTASKTEYDNLVTTAGWQGEGIAWYTTDQKTDKPVYRLYSRFNSAHFYTTSKAEYDKSVANGWTGEDVAWYVADDADTDVYRLYNDLSGEHLYTTNAAERDNLVANAGWTFEQVEYKVYAK